MPTAEQIAEARDMGAEAARSAASWTVDGNTSQAFIADALAMLDAGDPRADEYLPLRPTLSGEWADDDPTPITLWETVTGLDHFDAETDASLAYETLIGSAVDALASAWEDGVSETFESACERELRAALVDVAS